MRGCPGSARGSSTRKALDLVHEWIAKLPPSKEKPAVDLVRQSHEQQIARLGRADVTPTSGLVSRRSARLTATTSGAIALARASATEASTGGPRRDPRRRPGTILSPRSATSSSGSCPRPSAFARLGDVIDPNQVLEPQGRRRPRTGDLRRRVDRQLQELSPPRRRRRRDRARPVQDRREVPPARLAPADPRTVADRRPEVHHVFSRDPARAGHDRPRP